MNCDKRNMLFEKKRKEIKAAEWGRPKYLQKASVAERAVAVVVAHLVEQLLLTLEIWV